MDSVLSPHAGPKDKVQALMVGMWQLALDSTEPHCLSNDPSLLPWDEAQGYDLM